MNENETNNTTNDTELEGTVVDDTNTINETVEVVGDYSEQLNQIHEDLGIICCFLIFFTLVILLRYVYKFFDMFFVMR